jgi:hypothetical protein
MSSGGRWRVRVSGGSRGPRTIEKRRWGGGSPYPKVAGGVVGGKKKISAGKWTLLSRAIC